jgi:predicted aldo/keto reductase-like oxidoreductase
MSLRVTWELEETFMSENGIPPVNRRSFLQVGAATAATAVAGTSANHGLSADTGKATAPFPRRPLGKTGVDVTILNQGTWRSPDSIDRLLRMGYANGIRYIDTAKIYGSEPAVAKFFEGMPAGTRKEYFLVTKDAPRTPRQLIALLDQRLAALRTDYLDLLFIHGIGGRERLDWPKSKEFKETIAAIKKSGKCRFVGFSCHDELKAQFLMAAAEGGFVDAIMVAYTPWLQKDDPLNRALDACHEKGIGLISMKQILGNSDPRLQEVPKHIPTLAEKGLSAYQGLLHSIWTDERISSCCVSMRNTDQLRENIHAARVFEPLKQADMHQLRQLLIASAPTMCANCDGRCSRAAGTAASLGDLVRLYTYHDHCGLRGEARRLYSELEPKQRDWRGADLEAAREACHNRLDFASLLPKIDRELA